MSGLNEIIDWVESEVVLDPANDVRREFEDISRLFEEDGRLPLSDILQEQEGQFLKYLEDRLSTEQFLSETDEDFGGFEQRINAIESTINRLFQEIRRSPI